MRSAPRRLSRPKRDPSATRAFSASLCRPGFSKDRSGAARSGLRNSRKDVRAPQLAIKYNDRVDSQRLTVTSRALCEVRFKPMVIRLICQEERILLRMPFDHIDLSPLMMDPAAAEILLLARGQLNRAFRTHGLVPPDPLPLGDATDVDPNELDDPAAMGIEEAMVRFEESFPVWSSRMPVTLAPPVLEILRQTFQVLGHQRNNIQGPGAAAMKAYDFLRGRRNWDEGMADGT
jgi:hypothetical protein